MCSARTINSKISGTPKGVYLPISKLHSSLVVANLPAHNNLWLCYYVQVNSLWLKSSVASKWASKYLLVYHLFCCWWYMWSTKFWDFASLTTSQFLSRIWRWWPKKHLYYLEVSKCARGVSIGAWGASSHPLLNGGMEVIVVRVTESVGPSVERYP